jgi:hypothetical protein
MENTFKNFREDRKYTNWSIVLELRLVTSFIDWGYNGQFEFKGHNTRCEAYIYDMHQKNTQLTRPCFNDFGFQTVIPRRGGALQLYEAVIDFNLRRRSKKNGMWMATI